MGWLIDQTGSGEKAPAAYKLGIRNLKGMRGGARSKVARALPDETQAYLTRVITYFEEWRSLNKATKLAQT